LLHARKKFGRGEKECFLTFKLSNVGFVVLDISVMELSIPRFTWPQVCINQFWRKAQPGVERPNWHTRLASQPTPKWNVCSVMKESTRIRRLGNLMNRCKNSVLSGNPSRAMWTGPPYELNCTARSSLALVRS